MLTLPKYLGNPIEQQVGFATTTDGVRIAYATTGQGPALVYVVGWATHLERGIASPLYDRADGIRWLSRRNLYVRYDGRGFGLSDRDVVDFSLDARVRDLAAVVDTLGLDRFSILAVSSGGPTAIAYAARYPEQVARIVFLSCELSRASLVAQLKDHPVIGSERQYFAMLEMARSDWSSPIVRGMFVDLLFPEAGPAGRRVLIEFLRVSGEGPAVASFHDTMVDATDLARHVKAPSLVIHTRDDPAIPLSQGRLLASLIPGTRLEIFEGGHAPWTPDVLQAISDFLAEGEAAPPEPRVE
jgi:pimeloyl-ACP methyl ester carboxylesterase